MGQSLRLRDLVDIAISSSQYISYIGGENPNKFDAVYLYRRSPVSDIPERSEFLGDEIIPLYNERIILETNNRHYGIKVLSRS
jgi:hypothetical protein